MNFKGKRVLVTGSSGFIGSNLIKRLESLGASVFNFDLSNNLDIQNESQLKETIRKNFHVIYHLAGFSGSARSNKNILKSFKINLFPTISLLEFIVKYSPKTKLILSSSRLEYGKPLYLPVDENHPTNPTSAYGLSKLAATCSALVYSLKNNLDVTIFRTSNVYGPHTKSKFAGYNLVNHFIDLAKRDQTLTIFGNGEQERDYLYVDDLAEAFILAGVKNGSSVYNLGFGKGIKLEEMARLIIKKVGKGKLSFTDWSDEFKSVETGNYVTDITKIKEELEFKPRIDFEKGIDMAIKNSG